MDTLIIEHELFLAYKPKDCLKKLQGEKITAIFLLDCFNETKQFVPKAFHPSHTSHANAVKPRYNNRGERGGQEHHIKAPRSRIGVQSYQEKFLREITSILNKVNASNIDVMAKKILKIMDANNLDQVVNIILTKAVTNGTYMQHFVSLLDNIKIPEMNALVNTFVQSYLSGLQDVFKTQMAAYNYEDYDQFCQFLKQKNTILSTNNLALLYMSRDGVIDACPDVYFDKILSMIDSDLPVHLQDMLIKMIADFFKTKHASTITYGTLNEVYHTSLESFLSSKSKFQVQDVMAAYSRRNIFVCKARTNRK